MEELPIDSETVNRAPPPLSLRTDSMGIFTVLGFSGAAQLFTGVPGSVAEVVSPVAQLMWASTLLIGGVFGLCGTLVPARWRIIGFAMEAVARLALGIGALAYAAALGVAIGWNIAGFNILVFVGISIMMLVGALQIVRWLFWQRQVVTTVMRLQADVAEHDGDERGQG